MSRFIIREAVVADAPGIAAVQVNAWRQRLSQWAPEWFVARFQAGEQATKYAARIQDPTHKVLIAVTDDAVSGFVSYKPNSNPPEDFSHEIGALYTSPDHEKQGIGTALLENLLYAARREGVKSLVLWTFAANDPARRLYERCSGELLPYTEATGMDLDIPHVSYGWHLR